jgi:hypothetical protein
MGRRIYIYRSGTTSKCALTVAKGDPRLPPPTAPDRWHFWMQIGPLQPEHRQYGFDLCRRERDHRQRLPPFYRVPDTAP